MSDKKDAYVRTLKAKIDAWNAEIDQATARAEQAQADVKRGWLERIEELKGKRDEAAAKLESLREGGESAWDEIRDGLEDSFHVWKDSFAKARAAFGQGFREGKKGGE